MPNILLQNHKLGIESASDEFNISKDTNVK